METEFAYDVEITVFSVRLFFFSVLLLVVYSKIKESQSFSNSKAIISNSILFSNLHKNKKGSKLTRHVKTPMSFLYKKIYRNAGLYSWFYEHC